MNIRQKAEALLDACELVTLASVSEQGYPRPCVLSKIKNEGIRKFWVATGANGVKTRHFQANPKAGACFLRDGDGMTLMGEVRIVDDPELKKAMWLPWFIEHFPGGMEDPNYCVLQFETNEATIWIEGEFVTLGGDAL